MDLIGLLVNILNLIDKVNNLSGEVTYIPKEFDALNDAYHNFINKCERTTNLTVAPFPTLINGKDELVGIFIFSKNHDEYINGAYITFGNDYDEKMTVESMYDYFEYSLPNSMNRVKMFDIDVFNKYLLPLVKEKILRTFENNLKDTPLITQENNENYLSRRKIERRTITDPKLTILTLLFLVTALFHYEEDCGYSDTFCIEPPYGFYIVLRFVACVYFAYKAFLLYPKKYKFSYKFIITALFSFIFNPFIKVKLELEQWLFVDFMAVITILFLEIPAFIYLHKRKQKLLQIKDIRNKEHNFKIREKIIKDTYKDNRGVTCLINDTQKYKSLHKYVIEILFEKYAIGVFEKMAKLNNKNEDDEIPF